MKASILLLSVAGLLLCPGLCAQKSGPGELALARKDWACAEKIFRSAAGAHTNDGQAWGRVEQTGETSPDGKTWSLEYELIYVPSR